MNRSEVFETQLVTRKKVVKKMRDLRRKYPNPTLSPQETKSEKKKRQVKKTKK